MYGRTYIENDKGLDLYRKKYNFANKFIIRIDAWKYTKRSFKP